MASGWLKKGYWGLVQGENFIRHFFLLAIRLYWGYLLVISGIGKWMHIHGVSEYFSSLGLPAPLLIACLVGTAELLGGLSLVFGFLSRIFSIFLICVFAGAYATAHKESLAQVFVKPSLFVAEQPFMYLYTALVILCFGPGLFSIDYWWEKKTYGSPL